MTKRLQVGGLVTIALALSGMGWAALALQEQGFPHEAHEGLFPLCAGCHTGVPTNEFEDFFPSVDLCNQCHTGDQQRTDTWSQRGPREGNLKFRHGFHESLFGDMVSCEGCHSTPGGVRMAVSGDIQLEGCWQCHQATEHQIDAPCTTCHVPLAESGLSVERIARFPMPVDHGATDFLLEGHGSLATEGTGRCSTCHTANRCAACHVDTEKDPIQAMHAAPEGMELPPTWARYQVPAFHQGDDWFEEHGGSASRAECSTCHTSNDCMACHVSPAPAVVQSLVSLEESAAPGIGLEGHAPNSHESLFFMDSHPVLGASNGQQCATCHVERFCVECHDGPSNGGYHPPDFVARHPAEAFGQDTECATCHNTQAFCRSCHLEAGFGSTGRLGPGYHDAQSLWLLRHGQAARQNLETCVSCHAQNDCTQCHSVVGAFKVSPHSSDFDARSAWDRSPTTCLACHIRNPIGG